VRILEIRSQELRLPARALEALERDVPVVVTHYGRRRHVVLSEERFALVAPLLELLEAGASIPSELLLTEGDLELERALAEDRQPSAAEEEQIDDALRAAGIQ
jgi:PHD/YefM family antitoxin component YafN of YafNO toxin-antitoxin module